MKPYVPREGTIPTLPVPDLSGVRSVHLVGIGGAGMSGLARLLLARGLFVTGSDLKDSPALGQLRAIGAQVVVGHNGESLGDPDAVVVSSAIQQGNPEVAEARRRGVPVYARAQVLAALSLGYRTVAVAGTHGKTTTTSMLGVLLERLGLDPTYLVGGDLNESGSNARSGRGPVLVAEADESDGSFLLLSPEIGVVTNVESDHLDFYADREEVEAAFAAFCGRAERLVACGDDPGTRRVLAAASVDALTYGEGDGNVLRVVDVEIAEDGGRGTILMGRESAELWVPQPGRHAILDAAAAIAAATLLGVDAAAAAEGIRGFAGVRRRFERRGRAGGAEFVDDYAHHPTEIGATLEAAVVHRAARLVAVFQPHRYSRTAALWRALGESLAAADVVVLTDVYGAGETPVPGVTGKLLVDALVESEPHKRIVYLPHRSDVAAFLAREVRDGDLVLTIGAGDITMVGEETMALLRDGDGRGS